MAEEEPSKSVMENMRRFFTDPAKPGYSSELRQDITGAIEQSEQSAKKVAVSEGSFWPKTWREALPLLVWGVVIFASGFEGVASLLHGEWLQAFLGLGGMFGLTAMLIHWTRIRDNFSDVRWLMAAIMVALTVAALSPYVEQHRWPFSAVIHDPPTAQEIAKATAPVQAELDRSQSNLITMTKSRDELQYQIDALRQQKSSNATAAGSSSQPYELEDAQIRKLADALFEAKNQLPSSIDIRRVMYDGVSMGLSVQIGRAFDLASIPPVYNWSRPNTPRDTGVRIRVGDIQAIPDGAKKVAAALRIVGIESSFETLSGEAPGNFMIFVGPKP
jgi:hypothetical protein